MQALEILNICVQSDVVYSWLETQTNFKYLIAFLLISSERNADHFYNAAQLNFTFMAINGLKGCMQSKQAPWTSRRIPGLTSHTRVKHRLLKMFDRTK